MPLSTPFQLPYKPAKGYSHSVAYFSMEFGIDQALKIYSGGLGFLAGSHMRSAYNLKQNLIGIGIKWTWGYYDQTRNQDRTMRAEFQEKEYSFLEETDLLFEIEVNGHPVKVRAYYLAPETFGTAPMFLLSTDIPENDYLARQISKRLYDSNVEAKIAQYILLGKGGGRPPGPARVDPRHLSLQRGARPAGGLPPLRGLPRPGQGQGEGGRDDAHAGGRRQRDPLVPDA